MTDQQQKEMYLKQLLANQLTQQQPINLQDYVPQVADPMQQLMSTMQPQTAAPMQPVTLQELAMTGAPQQQLSPIEQLQVQQAQTQPQAQTPSQTDPMTQLQAQAQQQVQQNAAADMYEKWRDFGLALQMRHSPMELEKLMVEREKVRGDIAAKKLKATEESQKQQKELLNQQILFSYLTNQGVPIDRALAMTKSPTVLSEEVKQMGKDRLYHGKREGQTVYYDTENILGEKQRGFVPEVGTKEYYDAQGEFMKRLELAQRRFDTNTKMLSALHELQDKMMRDPTTTGFIGYLSSRVAGTQASSVKALMSHIKSIYLVETAVDIKEKYGSIFGQLTQGEVERIEKTLSSLDSMQSPEDAIAAVAELIEMFSRHQEKEIKMTLPNLYNQMNQSRMLFRESLDAQDVQTNPILFDKFNEVARLFGQQELSRENQFHLSGVYFPQMIVGGQPYPILTESDVLRLKRKPEYIKELLGDNEEYIPMQSWLNAMQLGMQMKRDMTLGRGNIQGRVPGMKILKLTR